MGGVNGHTVPDAAWQASAHEVLPLDEPLWSLKVAQRCCGVPWQSPAAPVTSGSPWRRPVVHQNPAGSSRTSPGRPTYHLHSHPSSHTCGFLWRLYSLSAKISVVAPSLARRVTLVGYTPRPLRARQGPLPHRQPTLSALGPSPLAWLLLKVPAPQPCRLAWGPL